MSGPTIGDLLKGKAVTPPAPPPTGEEIDQGVRAALLEWISDLELNEPLRPREIWKLLKQDAGYGDISSVVEKVAAAYGEDAAEPVAAAFRTERAIKRAVPPDHPDRYALPALLSIPAPLFVRALEIAVAQLRQRYFHVDEDVVDTYDRAAIAEINRQFGRHGIHYEFAADGHAQWVGDSGAREETVAPALDALADGRLSGVASEFHAARDHLRAGTPKDLEDAVDESAKAVESAMKVLLDEHRVPRTGKETAFPLFGMLVTAHIVEAEADHAVLGAARIRNSWGGHGAGAAPRAFPPGLAALTVHSAATAITYLATRLP